MQIKLVRTKQIQHGDVVMRGSRFVKITDIIKPYKRHWILVCDDDLIYCKDDSKFLKVVQKMGI